MVDPEKYPGTTVFVNLRNITSQKALEEAESLISIYRLTELYNDSSIIGDIGDEINFDLSHLKSIHKHLFQDIYSWAGQTRSYNMAIGHDVFAPPDKFEYWANKIALEIKQDSYLLHLDRENIVKILAVIWDYWVSCTHFLMEMEEHSEHFYGN
ncbi:MAG: Fic family protein [Ectothiorhodospiraceae bacterium]|nr:Fic family protein [Ectothiorhodospiraceae bacterium]